MKLKNFFALAVFFLALIFGANAMAISAAKQSPEPPVLPVELGADVNNLVFTGTVRKIPNGTALVTNNATYHLAGGNFDGIVGKVVNIIGTVVKEGSVEKIQVARAQLAAIE